MKSLLMTLGGALLALSINAADLTGHWVAEQRLPNGPVRETSVWIKATGNAFTGYLWNERQGNQPIVDGKLDGNQLSFVVVTDNFGEERRQQYTATLTADGLVLHLPAFGGRGAGRGGRGIQPDLIAKRVSSEDPPPMRLKISLGAPPEVKPNGLAKSPPMGWNSWNKFRNQVSDQLVRETADAMVRSGMRDAGYVYLNIDDTWEADRDADGNIRPNDRFPDMKGMIAYVHGKGLKFGIYSSPGPKTCAGYQGSFQHEEQDAKTYAGWGVDYLKYDWCSAGAVYQSASMPAVYAKMGQALLSSGRPIVFSLCEYGAMKVQDWGAKVGGNLWRTTGDIRDNWESMSNIGFDQQNGLEDAAGPGHWNDPDMLEIGNGGMTTVEYRAHMSLWSMLAAPLIAGNDLRNIPPEILEILTNKEVIAIDQGTLGKQGKRVSKNGDLEVWSRPLAGGQYAVALFNRGQSAYKMTLRPADLGLGQFKKIRDLWAHSDTPVSPEFTAEVPSHGVVMLRIEGHHEDNRF